MSNQIGVVGLAVMGQNLAMNIADKGFSVAVFNRSPQRVDDTVAVAQKEGLTNLHGYKTMESFVQAIQKPRKVIIMVMAGKPVDETIDKLCEVLDAGDFIIDGGNEWYLNTEARAKRVAAKNIMYMGMGVSGGEKGIIEFTKFYYVTGARYGPSLMPGGPKEAYDLVEPILKKIAAQVEGDGPCVTYIGPGGSGNYVKMIHNGIEYGDMQLISECYDLLKSVGGLSNEELHQVFTEWNQGELQSFLIEITSQIFAKKDDKLKDGSFLLDKVLDVSGSKGTGKWTVQQAADQGIAVPTIAAALDGRYLSELKKERVAASEILNGPTSGPVVDKKQLVQDVRNALYAAKICSYAQGMNIIRKASKENNWNLDLGEIARIWKAGCIIRAIFLDRIKKAYQKDFNLASLLVDPEFAAELNARQASWRRVIIHAIEHGVPTPALSSSLAYYDTYRRKRLPANLVQAQRDLFGAHTYLRTDEENPKPVHSEWAE